jgi:hypothetical protein
MHNLQCSCLPERIAPSRTEFFDAVLPFALGLSGSSNSTILPLLVTGSADIFCAAVVGVACAILDSCALLDVRLLLGAKHLVEIGRTGSKLKSKEHAKVCRRYCGRSIYLTNTTLTVEWRPLSMTTVCGGSVNV